MVVLWHYTTSLHARYLPYGTTYAGIPVLDHGWVGVDLFFLISGHVILRTLTRCRTYGAFMAKRWLRLFPAMLVASVTVFVASRFIGAWMPHGRPPPVNVLPGLTFLILPIWESILQRPVDELDGVYWTLYVEMGFYVTFGALYFLLGWRRGLAALAAFWLTVVAASRLAVIADRPDVARLIELLQWIGAEYFGWFVSGALFFQASQTRSQGLYAGAIVVGCTSAFTSGLWQPSDPQSRAYLVGCVVLFAALQRRHALQRWIANDFLLFAGAVSYPLYLLHNELGLGLIGAIGQAWPDVQRLLPVLMTAAMLCLSWWVARHVEPVLTRCLRRVWPGLARR